MPGKLPDLSTTQLIASGMATLAAAVGASYLGVYGTILGAAFMSVASTAGAAVCKHYLDQGREQIKDLTHVQASAERRDAAQDAAARAVEADPTRTAVWSDPNATRMDLDVDAVQRRLDDPGATRLEPSAAYMDPNATRLDPSQAVAGDLAGLAGEEAVREAARRSAWEGTVAWARQRWVPLVLSSAAVFAFVLGGITLFEAASGSPIGDKGNGLTVTKVLGGDGDGGGRTDETPSDGPSGSERPTGEEPSGGPSGETPKTGTPSTGTATDEPAPPRTERPTDKPTSTVPTAPTAPGSSAPSSQNPGGEEKPGGEEQQRNAPAE
ncbi:hypothetical protein [Actinomadura sp. NEAU-AAG7]|uniref:hypothetical protein n=1 Tax=Actinomadura sp. NEAU-AAG7 TaxID=2839640 RepID=UPI001BE44532|nr:hypothetical protein [Actinomadura sp. NEAU-AAG7]MBT2211137.1 hypothetical protein [Actinomadura sp. NEAU-AAG7]